MHNDNVLDMRFTEQHITPAALTLPLLSLFSIHLVLVILSSAHLCSVSLSALISSLSPPHIFHLLSLLNCIFPIFSSISLAAKLSVFPRPHLSASLPLSLSFDSPLPHGYISLPLSLSSCSLRPLGDCRYLHKSLNFDP